MGDDYTTEGCLNLIRAIFRDTTILSSPAAIEFAEGLGIDRQYYLKVLDRPHDARLRQTRRIRAMLDSGVTSTEIVRELGVSRSRVAQVLREMRDE